MKQFKFVYLFILFIFKYNAQESTTSPSIDWNGDSKICIIDPSSSSTDDIIPLFPNQVEFVIEKVKINRQSDILSLSELTTIHYLYNYDHNNLVLIENINNTSISEYYYYDILKKSTYYHRNICFNSDINQENEMDGKSAMKLPNNTWHIRPLDHFLLFSGNNTSETKFQRKFLGQSIIRGIPVDQWELCIINKTEFRTSRIIWSLAQNGVIMPTGLVTNLAVPIHALINTSVLFSNNTEVEKYDEMYNVHSYRTTTSNNFVPPKGVFCQNNQDKHLNTLQEFGIRWPDYFSVRVEALTTSYSQWQTFHLRYHHDRQLGIRRLRYDYLPMGAADYISVIHDYGDNLTYAIDRHLGRCFISRGVEYPDVDPIQEPIGFFIKHEDQFIFNSRERLWSFNGNRLCRTDSLRCLSVVSSIENYPAIIESDTGRPTGETWRKTDIEYGWSVRAPNARLPSGQERYFDYPVYLFLRFYQYNDVNLSSLTNVQTKDIEYEFYEISYERNPSDFDISLCYRSVNFEYLHLGFILKLSQTNFIDNNHFDRRLLERKIHENLMDQMKIKSFRVTEIEIYHENIHSDIIVFFTLLGPTPKPESPTGMTDDELTANQSYINLKKSIDDGTFEFTMLTTDNSTIPIQFRAISGSLKASKQLMSTHISGKQIQKETYTTSAQVTAIIGGFLVGILAGILIAIIIRIVRKQPIPYVSNSFSNPLPSIKFYNKQSTNDITTTKVSSDV